MCTFAPSGNPPNFMVPRTAFPGSNGLGYVLNFRLGTRRTVTVGDAVGTPTSPSGVVYAAVAVLFTTYVPCASGARASTVTTQASPGTSPISPTPGRERVH